MTLQQELIDLLEEVKKEDGTLLDLVDSVNLLLIETWSDNKPVAAYRELEVYEGASFTIYKDDRARGMGDGVDQFCDVNDEALRPGTIEFYRALQSDLETNYSRFLEAYFG